MRSPLHEWLIALGAIVIAGEKTAEYLKAYASRSGEATGASVEMETKEERGDGS